MLGFVTDRTEANVTRLKALSAKGPKMTATEMAEWMGDPLTAVHSVNLLRCNYDWLPVNATITNRLTYFTVSALEESTEAYGFTRIGNASDFEDKTLTLSIGSVVNSAGGSPKIALYWYDSTGSDEIISGSLASAGKVTFSTGANVNNRAYLAMRIYVTSGTPVMSGGTVRYNKVMLEFGSTQHEYVPYTPILPTVATKGALNYSDLNRIETAIAEIAETKGLDLTVKTNWSIKDVPKETDINRIRDNFKMLTTWTAFFNNYSELNDIERRLENLFATEE